MNWRPWRRHNPNECEGATAHKDAAASLAEAKANWPEVKRVSQSLRELRERNHFKEQVELIFQGGGKVER